MGIAKNMNDIIKIGNTSKIIISDNMDESGVPSLIDESIALTFTSPPYYNYVEYESDESDGNKESSYEEYLESLQSLFSLIYHKTMAGGRFVINITNMHSRKSVENKAFLYPIISDAINILQKSGFTFFDEIVWVKGGANAGALKGRPLFGSYPYPPTPKILNTIFENILVFVKDGKRVKVSKDIKELSKLTQEEWRIYTRGIWEVGSDRNTLHPATFPIEIAKRIIRMYSFVGDIVLDPYAGSGTAVIAADKWDRIGIGFEISKEYENAINDRKQQLLMTQTTLF